MAHSARPAPTDHLLLGAGGMGQVYRARDTDHKAQVAIRSYLLVRRGAGSSPGSGVKPKSSRAQPSNIAHIHGLEKSTLRQAPGQQVLLAQ